MRHHSVTFSPEGTLASERTVGELVAERPGRSRVFQTLQIDFCCQGGRTLREACERKGVALEDVLARLEAEQAAAPPPENNPADLPPHDLADYIVETHHGFLRRELPRLHAMSVRVAQVHGGHTPSLIEVSQAFEGLFLELDSHMMKEEQVLFPAVSEISRGRREPMPLDAPIAHMIEEHEETGEALTRLRELTNGYQPPAEACNTWRALFAGLADLEEDLHHHIHLENSVLFPAAQKLARDAG